MELTNPIYKHVHAGTDATAVDEAIDTLLRLLAPFAPHLAAEAYEQRHSEHVHLQPWPVADPAYLRADRATLVVQVNGKLRDRIDVDAEIGEDEAIAVALASDEGAAVARRQLSLGGSSPGRRTSSTSSSELRPSPAGPSPAGPSPAAERSGGRADSAARHSPGRARNCVVPKRL